MPRKDNKKKSKHQKGKHTIVTQIVNVHVGSKKHKGRSAPKRQSQPIQQAPPIIYTPNSYAFQTPQPQPMMMSQPVHSQVAFQAPKMETTQFAPVTETNGFAEMATITPTPEPEPEQEPSPEPEEIPAPDLETEAPDLETVTPTPRRTRQRQQPAIINTIETGIDYRKVNKVITNNKGLISSSLLSLNTSNGCYKMSYASAFTIQGTVLECMGLTNATYNALFDGTNFVIQFTKSVNLIRTRNLHIITPNLLYDNYNVATQSSTELKSIQVNVPPFSIINYSNTDNSASVIYNADVNDLIIQIRDDNNNFIDFNGQEWSMCIAIKTTNQAIKIHGSIQ